MGAAAPAADGASGGGRPAPRRRGAGRDLPVAIGVGLVLAALFLGTLAWSPWAFLAFVAVLIVVALVELDGALRAQGLRPATPVAAAAGLVAFFGAYAAGADAQVLALAVLVVGATAWVLLDAVGERAVTSLGATFLVALWVPFLASFIGLLLARDGGRWFVMMAIALTVTNDIGAYGFGNRWGRHKLAPSVSPGKTWEGFVGGLATVLLMAALVSTRTVPGLDLVPALVIGAGIAVAATVGDLAESLVKRDLGVKDLGRVLPGHGGVMDRVDAILFGLPTAHLLLRLFDL